MTLPSLISGSIVITKFYFVEAFGDAIDEMLGAVRQVLFSVIFMELIRSLWLNAEPNEN